MDLYDFIATRNLFTAIQGATFAEVLKGTLQEIDMFHHVDAAAKRKGGTFEDHAHEVNMALVQTLEEAIATGDRIAAYATIRGAFLKMGREHGRYRGFSVAKVFAFAGTLATTIYGVPGVEALQISTIILDGFNHMAAGVMEAQQPKKPATASVAAE